MLEQKNIESIALELFSFLKEFGFQDPLTRNLHSLVTTFDYLAENIGIEVQLDWRDQFAGVLIVRLEDGKLPNGYYVSQSDRKICRVHLKQALYNLGYRDEQINAEKFYKKVLAKKKNLPSFEQMKSSLETDGNLLKHAIDFLINNQRDIFIKA